MNQKLEMNPPDSTYTLVDYTARQIIKYTPVSPQGSNQGGPPGLKQVYGVSKVHWSINYKTVLKGGQEGYNLLGLEKSSLQ